MKKYIISVLLLATLLLAAYLSFGIYRSNILTANIESGDYVACFADASVETNRIDFLEHHESFDIRFAAHGNRECYAPYFPAIEVTSSKVTHWLHLVETSGDVQLSGKHASFGDSEKNWVFVDVGSQLKRDQSDPFYSVGTRFRDNPSWTAAPHLSLNWQGKVFGLAKVEDTFYLVGGVSWGFVLPSWSLKPYALYPRALDKSEWTNIVKALNKEYPELQFSDE
ncbi:hypothetical protein [Vibrio sonorensis]|uniref:hypothetical protein n=1 Tax=Vibrio sonorensis TaxID=1004316 RepID=UPI0008D9EC90|nr:hypothetical protein [Vibrio sonorensis]